MTLYGDGAANQGQVYTHTVLTGWSYDVACCFSCLKHSTWPLFGSCLAYLSVRTITMVWAHLTGELLRPLIIIPEVTISLVYG